MILTIIDEFPSKPAAIAAVVRCACRDAAYGGAPLRSRPSNHNRVVSRRGPARLCMGVMVVEARQDLLETNPTRESKCITSRQTAMMKSSLASHLRYRRETSCRRAKGRGYLVTRHSRGLLTEDEQVGYTQAVLRGAKELRRNYKRSLQNVRGAGYQLIAGIDQGKQGQGHSKRARRNLSKALEIVRHTDRSEPRRPELDW
jgi:hypothetical protein